MKRTILLTAAIIFLFVPATFPQRPDGDLNKLQKELKSSLVKNNRSVFRVNFDQCRVTFKIIMGQSSGGPSGGRGPGGTFPQDEASSSLGSRQDGGVYLTTIRREIDLSLLTPSQVKSASGFRKDFASVTVLNGNNDAAIREKRDGKITSIPMFTLGFRSKVADKVVLAWQNTIGYCSAKSTTD